MDCEAFRDDMMDVLYGEGGEAAVRRLESHHAACPDCRREMAALRRLRGDLAQWRLPEPLTAAAAPARAHRLPMVLAAAAGLVLALAAGLTVAGAELSYDHGSFAFRLGRAADTAALAAAERRHEEEIAVLRAEIARTRAGDPREVLSTVSQMIHESEARQEASRATAMRDLRTRADAQRQYDLARVSAGLAYLDGKAGLQAARTTELVGHLLQASQSR